MTADWQQTTLGDVVSFKGGGTPATDNAAYWNGDIPWVSPKDMKFSEVGDSIDKITPEAIKNSAASLIPKDAILIVVRSGILARTIPIGITTRPLAVNQDIKALCSNGDVDPRFLHYFMQMTEPDILKLVTRGATVHRLSTDSLKALKFPKPPLPEQQRIVATLDEVFARLASATANAEKNVKNARELFDSYLNSAIVRKDARWRERAIADVCDIGDGNHSSKYPKTNEMVSTGVPFIRGTNLVNGKISDDDLLFISEEKHQELRKGHLKTGDVLFTNRGEIGKLAIVDESFDGANLNSQIAWLRCRSELLPQFLFFVLQSSEMKRHFLATKSGAALQQFTIKMLREVKIIFPPIEVQKQIVETLNRLEGEVGFLTRRYRDKIAILAKLKDAILQKAISGELAAPPSGAIKEAAE